MIWEDKCEIIVMLTKLKENGRVSSPNSKIFQRNFFIDFILFKNRINATNIGQTKRNLKTLEISK